MNPSNSQFWMTQNLRVSRYSNGDIIPQVKDATEWKNLTTGAWCYYHNDPLEEVLYNWYAVNDPRGLAPKGWHIPSENEWSILSNKDKEEVLKSPTRNGFREFDGSFYGSGSYLWSSSQTQWSSIAYKLTNTDIVRISQNINLGLPVRCVKD